jgi:hypothetical protein
VPLNVLNDLEFLPPLHAGKKAASQEGSVNKCNKVHFEIAGRDLLSWSSWASPGKGLVAAFGDCNTPAKNSHVVAFGPDADLDVGMQLSNVDVIQESFKHLLPFDDAKVKRIVSCTLPRNVSKKETNKTGVARLAKRPILERHLGILATRIHHQIPGSSSATSGEHSLCKC